VGLFSYLLLRAIYVPPLHDEIATYFHYIESGDYFSRGMILDANNHVLNSFLSRIIYRIHDGAFFWFRVPNLLAFVLYFWGCFQFSSELKNRLYSFVLLAALTSTPFVLEYFAFCRGYGLGLGFFIPSLVFLRKYLQTTQLKNLSYTLVFATLSIYANLIFINSYLLTILLLIIHVAIQRKYDTRIQLRLKSVALIGFLLASIPMFAFSFALKIGGALYYGSLEGIWDVTGKSLVEHTLFTSSALWMWILAVLLLAILFFAIFKLISLKSIPRFFSRTENLLIYFLLGNIIASIFLATFLQVNYPEDRAAMYLIPLFMLSFGFVCTSLGLKQITLVLLFFPGSLIFNTNLSTSIVTPDQRLNPAFYESIRAEVKDKSILVYPTSALNWAYYERTKKEKKLTQSRQEIDTHFDYIMTRKTLFETIISPSEYALFAVEPLSQTYVFKRKKEFKIRKIETHTIPTYWGKEEFIPIYEDFVDDTMDLKLHHVTIQGKMLIDSAYNNISLVFSTENEKQETLFYDAFQFRWFFGARKLDLDFKGNATFPAFKGDEKKIKIYIWNPFHRVVKLDETKIKLSYF
jgi:hypothetical protein